MGRVVAGASYPQAQGRDTAEGSPDFSFRAPDRLYSEGRSSLHSAKLLVSRRCMGYVEEEHIVLPRRKAGLGALPRGSTRARATLPGWRCAHHRQFAVPRLCGVAELTFRVLTELASDVPSAGAWAMTR